MHKLIFYPVGNGDCNQIVLANGKRILFDFRHKTCGENDSDPYIDLKKQLKKELSEAKRDYFDVVAFTHGDKDHIENSTTFFELWHAEKYQGNSRIKINELWVPAAMILETGNNDQQSAEFIILRQEARYRLKKGKGIQIFSNPEMLKKWMEDNDISYEERKHLFTDAGQLAKGFSLEDDEVEFFCHSPFIKHCDEGDDLRNPAALIFQVRFNVQGTETNFLETGDTEYEVWEDIVNITQYHGNEDRLKWDIYNLPHHCSYKTLSSEKGEKETIPTEKVEELLLSGQPNSYIVCSSKPIDKTKDAYEQTQPPHVQAKNCYLRYLEKIKGARFLVTMEHPNRTKPEPIVFEINKNGHLFKESKNRGSTAVISSVAPRAGNDGN